MTGALSEAIGYSSVVKYPEAQTPTYEDRVKVEPGQVVVMSAQGFPLWHLPWLEAERMTPAELRVEVRYAAREYGVPAKALWDALRKLQPR